jgi:hypothetical protein
MRRDVLEHLYRNEDLLRFVREQPQWYRKLTRNPEDLESIEIASLQYFKKSIPDRVGQLYSNVQLASFMLEAIKSMNTNSS